MILDLYLVDVVKTRYLGDLKGRYKSVLDCVLKTYQADGLIGFLRGWTPAYWRLGPHTVLSFIMIEEMRTYLGYNNI